MNPQRNSTLQTADALDPQREYLVEEKLELPIWQPPKNGLPRFFAGSFNLGDGITMDSLIPESKPGNDTEKVLEIILISANEAFVRYAENSVGQRIAFNDVYSYLNPNNVNFSNGGYDHRQHTHVSTIEPGRLVKQGEKWQMVEKVTVRYDALTPEQVQAQVASISPPVPVDQQPAVEVVNVPERVADQEPKVEGQPGLETKAVEQPAVEVQALDEQQPVVKQQDFALNQPSPDVVLDQEPEPVLEQTTATTGEAQREAMQLTLLADEQAKQEGIKENFYVLLLPEEYEELRQYLNNDGFLNNEEINAALRDARLERDELVHTLATLNVPSDDVTQQAKMADYLWELHEILQDPTLDQVRADQFYQIQTIHPIPEARRKPGEEVQQEEATGKSDKTIEIVNGGLVANFLHNYKKVYNLKATPALQMDKKTRYQWQDVEASLEKMGLTREMLLESGNLDRLLKGEKTGLLDFTSEFDGQKTPLRGKIYLVKQGAEIKPFFQTQKQTLQIPEQYLGYTFSSEDKDILKQKGELGKRVELTDSYTKKKFDAYIGVDQDTNSLTVWRADRVFIPMKIKNVDVTKEQQETLRQGGAIRLTGLESENGQKFDADVFVSAGRRSLGFSPPSEAIKQSIDVKTAQDLNRSSDQLQGTSAGAATTQDKRPEQKQKKAEAKQKGVEPAVALKDGPGTKPQADKGQAKNKKAQQEQGLNL